jgi:hypothetical protein
MALPSTDGRTHKPIPTVIAGLRLEMLGNVYEQVDSDDKADAEAGAALLRTFLDSLKYEAESKRLLEVFITKADGCSEVLTIVFGVDGEGAPLGVFYEVFASNYLGPDRTYRRRLTHGSVLHRLAADAMEYWATKLSDQLTKYWGV